jgi:hypothetical protein
MDDEKKISNLTKAREENEEIGRREPNQINSIETELVRIFGKLRKIWINWYKKENY